MQAQHQAISSGLDSDGPMVVGTFFLRPIYAVKYDFALHTSATHSEKSRFQRVGSDERDWNWQLRKWSIVESSLCTLGGQKLWLSAGVGRLVQLAIRRRTSLHTSKWLSDKSSKYLQKGNKVWTLSTPWAALNKSGNSNSRLLSMRTRGWPMGNMTYLTPFWSMRDLVILEIIPKRRFMHYFAWSVLALLYMEGSHCFASKGAWTEKNMCWHECVSSELMDRSSSLFSCIPVRPGLSQFKSMGQKACGVLGHRPWYSLTWNMVNCNDWRRPTLSKEINAPLTSFTADIS